MLKNAYLLEKIGADTAENERNFAKQLATTLLPYPLLPILPYPPTVHCIRIGTSVSTTRTWRTTRCSGHPCFVLDAGVRHLTTFFVAFERRCRVWFNVWRVSITISDFRFSASIWAQVSQETWAALSILSRRKQSSKYYGVWYYDWVLGKNNDKNIRMYIFNHDGSRIKQMGI